MAKHFGVCYYPELYPSDKSEAFIAEDIKLMRNAGFDVVRMAEFTWCLLEPSEGEYDLDWLESIINRLGENGIYTVLCTPTACQPVWMAKKYPSTLYVDNNGVQRSYGGRHYHCYNDPTFRRFTRDICLELSKRFGNNPYVLGFQVDNEMAQEHSGRCQCPTCKALFKDWLKEKFDSIDELNEAFGSLFWGQCFDSFDDVEMPATSARNNVNSNIGWHGTNMPSLRLAFDRFCSDSIIGYFDLQKEALHAYSDKPVTHNTTHFATNDVDYNKLAGHMDLAAVDHYPGALSTTGHGSAAVYAKARGYKDRNFWLLETLCGGGNGNWGYQGMPHAKPGTFRQNIAFAYANGAELITAFKFSVFPAGFECWGSGLIDLDRVPGRRYDEFCAAGKDFAALKELLGSTRIRSEAAIVVDYSSLWIHRIKPINNNFNYPAMIRGLHAQLAAAGINVDIIGPEHELSDYKLVLLPFAPLADSSFAGKCREYVEGGGSLAAICMPFARSEWAYGNFEQRPLGMTDLFGVRVMEEEPVFEGQTDAAINLGELTVRSHFWQETLEIKDAAAIGVFADTYRAGNAVFAKKQSGKGKALYFGTMPSDEDMPKFVDALFTECGITRPSVQPVEGVSIITRENEDDRYLMVFNFTDESVDCAVSAALEPVFKSHEDISVGNALHLPRKGFAVLKEV